MYNLTQRWNRLRKDLSKFIKNIFKLITLWMNVLWCEVNYRSAQLSSDAMHDEVRGCPEA